jgi:hypothetical protein
MLPERFMVRCPLCHGSGTHCAALARNVAPAQPQIDVNGCMRPPRLCEEKRRFFDCPQRSASRNAGCIYAVLAAPDARGRMPSEDLIYQGFEALAPLEAEVYRGYPAGGVRAAHGYVCRSCSSLARISAWNTEGFARHVSHVRIAPYANGVLGRAGATGSPTR